MPGFERARSGSSWLRTASSSEPSLAPTEMAAASDAAASTNGSIEARGSPSSAIRLSIPSAET